MKALESRSPHARRRSLTGRADLSARLEARPAGRGGSMDGCADMMTDGVMMGGSQPNLRWRSSPSR